MWDRHSPPSSSHARVRKSQEAVGYFLENGKSSPIIDGQRQSHGTRDSGVGGGSSPEEEVAIVNPVRTSQIIRASVRLQMM